MNLIKIHITELQELCRKHKVDTLYVFGSVLTTRFRAESDIDFLVNFKKQEIPLLQYADNFFDFMYALESLFGRKIDLVCDDAIRNKYFRMEVDETKELVYG